MKLTMFSYLKIKAFSLVELMVVIAIIGILSAIAVPSYKNYVIRSRIVEVLTIMESYKIPLINAYNSTGSFPIGTQVTGISTQYLTNLDYGTITSYNQSIWIRGYISANVGLPAAQKYIILFLKAKNDMIQVYCGQFDTSGDYVALQYLPSSCQGTNISALEGT